jgi:hypothetical protein
MHVQSIAHGAVQRPMIVKPGIGQCR